MALKKSITVLRGPAFVCYCFCVTSYRKMAAGPRKDVPGLRVCPAHLREDPGIPGPRMTRYARMCVWLLN